MNTNDTRYCTSINDTVYCNGICSECGNYKEEVKEVKEEAQEVKEELTNTDREQTIKDMGIKLTITGSRVENSPFAKGYNRKYRIKLTKGNKEFTFAFHDSVYNYQNNKKLNKLDTLYSVLLDMSCYDNARGFEDFANEFGYELYNDDYTGYNKKALRIYNACEKTSNSLHKLFNNAELEKLQEIFQNY